MASLGRGVRTKLQAARTAVRSLSYAFADELRAKLDPLRTKKGLPDPWQLAEPVYSPGGHFTLSATRTPLREVPATMGYTTKHVFEAGKGFVLKAEGMDFLELLIKEGEDFAVEEMMEDLLM
jgi:hypothetical protein